MCPKFSCFFVFCFVLFCFVLFFSCVLFLFFSFFLWYHILKASASHSHLPMAFWVQVHNSPPPGVSLTQWCNGDSALQINYYSLLNYITHVIDLHLLMGKLHAHQSLVGKLSNSIIFFSNFPDQCCFFLTFS